MTLHVQKVRDLPVQELAEMLADSQIAGFRAIERLINDWETAANRFALPGEALFIARQRDYRIVGVGGLNRDPYSDATPVGRVRRLYVMQDSRRQGIGRRLAHQIIQTAQPNFNWLQVRTTNPAAAQFYQSLGFIACESDWTTHTLNLVTVHVESSFGLYNEAEQ